MKILCVVVLIFFETGAFAQFRSTAVPPSQYFHSIVYPTQQKTFIPKLLSDPIQNARQPSPVLTNFSASDWRAQSNYFVGTVTTMSFNKGKFGTFYYWDVQGNLRGTRGFIDLSGKNKRGVKLVFPWRKF